MKFEFNLEDNIFRLHDSLKDKTWEPDKYISFFVRDPKLRNIHKASVCDRVLFQAIYRVLYKIFDPHFIHDSYSCRVEKGTHKGVLRLEEFVRKVSDNHNDLAFALKCDVKKFFDSISHDILIEIIKRKVGDEEAFWLIAKIINSFEKKPGIGLPLGNVTSQLFANIYLNEFDQFAKHNLKIKYYVRYCDDFIVLSEDRNYLTNLIPIFTDFILKELILDLHPNKISIRKLRQGIDFLGYVAIPHFKVLRTSTKRRILKRMAFLKKELKSGNVSKEKFEQITNSYLGILKHCHGEKIKERILDKSLCSRTGVIPICQLTDEGSLRKVG